MELSVSFSLFVGRVETVFVNATVLFYVMCYTISFGLWSF
jgi:Na+/proline symporter